LIENDEIDVPCFQGVSSFLPEVVGAAAHGLVSQIFEKTAGALGWRFAIDPCAEIGRRRQKIMVAHCK
jgi:hypothetical protein